MKVEDVLVRRFRESPQEEFSLIVRVSASVDEGADRLQAKGVPVRRKLRLIQAVAVRVTGEKALQLVDEPWIVRLEEDREVRALNNPEGPNSRHLGEEQHGSKKGH